MQIKSTDSDDVVFHWTLYRDDGFLKQHKTYDGDYADLKRGPGQAASSMCRIVSGVGGSVR